MVILAGNGRLRGYLAPTLLIAWPEPIPPIVYLNQRNFIAVSKASRYVRITYSYNIMPRDTSYDKHLRHTITSHGYDLRHTFIRYAYDLRLYEIQFSISYDDYSLEEKISVLIAELYYERNQLLVYLSKFRSNEYDHSNSFLLIFWVLRNTPLLLMIHNSFLP